MLHQIKPYSLKFKVALAYLACMPLAAFAASITLQGQFTLDDNVQLFDLVVAQTGSVDIRTYGYAGGSTTTGAVVPRGGFDPVLTLFDSAGAFLADNDEGVGVPVDSVTGEASDARITTTLTAGSYIAALTQFDNFSAGDLANGFVEAGNPHFTADPTFTTGGPCPSQVFRDISGTAGRCRDGNWAVDFVNVASVTERAPSSIPEPSSSLLLGCGLIGLAVGFRSRRRIKGRTTRTKRGATVT